MPSDLPTLATPLADVLGSRTAKALAKLDLTRVAELLWHVPRRYTQRGKLTDLRHLRIGERATVWARITDVATRGLQRRSGQRRPKSITTVTITDGHRTLHCTFFNQPWMGKKLEPGMEALFSGKVTAFRGRPQMSSPTIANTDGGLGDVAGVMETVESFAGGLVPVYPLTEGVTAVTVQRSVAHVLRLLGDIDDPVPHEIRRRRDLEGLDTALREIHRPPSEDALAAAQRRLRYDEALAMQLVLARQRAHAHTQPAEPCPPVAGGLLAAFDAALPWTLTDGQREAGETISADLAALHPMNRLLHGEVGSGKTVVALRAMLQVIDAGRQAVLLAPTEVLAAQHARSLAGLLGPLGRGGELGAADGATTVTLLTGSTGAAKRREVLLDIVSGQPGIVVGTHALLSDEVIFTNLGLAVIDEQHRFGVEQRDALRTQQGGINPPHLLVMTATPIPRTVAMTVYGDLDTSVLTDMPAGRADVSTTVVPAAEKPAWLDRAWQRVREEVAAGHQVYVVCPKIGDDDTSIGRDDGDTGIGGDGDAAEAGPESTEAGRRPPLAVLDMAEQLRTGPLAGLRLAVLHGRMGAADKDDVMRAVADGEVDVLVSTTVIEVGVDVANASMMIVMDADRFGMSQLHQLRGRIGRGAIPGVTLLVTEAPTGSPGRERLDAVAASHDGFRLAEADLALRREGDVLGTSQAGRRSSLKLLSLLRDSAVIAEAREDASTLVAGDAALGSYPGLAAMADAILAVEDQDYLGMS